MASLNTTVTVSRLPIPVAPSAGLVLFTVGAVKSPVVKLKPKSAPMALPLASCAVPAMVTVYTVCELMSAVGVKVKVSPLSTALPATAGLMLNAASVVA